EQPVRAPVDVVGHDHVVALRKKVRDRIRRGHPRSERETPAAALERGEAGFEGRTGGVAGARVFVALVLPHRFLRERRGLEDRDDDGTGRGFRVLPGVDGERLEARLARSLLHVVASMPRLSRDLTVHPCARASPPGMNGRRERYRGATVRWCATNSNRSAFVMTETGRFSRAASSAGAPPESS